MSIILLHILQLFYAKYIIYIVYCGYRFAGGHNMFSVVIPVYNEEKKLYDNVRKISTYMKKYDYEIILVDDGSRDKTWEIINRLHNDNTLIKGIRFSRNFGKEYALCAGIAETIGNAVITMDADLQHPPEYIDIMIKKWQEGYKIVNAIKDKRIKENFKKRIGANIFYTLLKKLTGYDLKNNGDFKIIDRQVVNEINKFGESQIFFRGIVEWVGYKKCNITYTMKEREGDKSKFNMKSLFKLALTAITSFSPLLLYLSMILSIVFFIVAVVFGIQMLFSEMLKNVLNPFEGIVVLQLIIGACILR